MKETQGCATSKRAKAARTMESACSKSRGLPALAGEYSVQGGEHQMMSKYPGGKCFK